MKLKCITLNIWFGGKLFDNIIAFLKKENPDILLLQEVYDGTDEVLEKRFRSFHEMKKLLDFSFADFASGFLDTVQNGFRVDRGNAIFSKFPIVKKENIFFDILYSTTYIDSEKTAPFAPRNMQHVLIQLPEKKLNVFNVHGIWREHGEDDAERLRMSDIIMQHTKNKEHVLLAGDFNLKPNTQTVHNIEKYLHSVFNNSLISTFNMKHKTKNGYATAAVDMFFISKNIKIQNAMCPAVDVSDHYPLLVNLEV
jgi:endonuclease/exonuclease/phosphatase family metal-dependent hydrolase